MWLYHRFADSTGLIATICGQKFKRLEIFDETRQYYFTLLSLSLGCWVLRCWLWILGRFVDYLHCLQPCKADVKKYKVIVAERERETVRSRNIVEKTNDKRSTYVFLLGHTTWWRLDWIKKNDLTKSVTLIGCWISSTSQCSYKKKRTTERMYFFRSCPCRMKASHRIRLTALALG